MRLINSWIVSLLLITLSGTLLGDTIVSVIGDIDGFSSNDPEDIPPRSQDVLDALANAGDLPPIDLDQPLINQRMGFSHFFSMPSGQSIIEATLTVGQNPTPGTYTPSDCLRLDINVDKSIEWSTQSGPRALFADQLGFVPSQGITTEVIWDLSVVPMRQTESSSPTMWNLLPELADGEFNIISQGDSGIDYSILEIVTIPEPATVCFLLLSCVASLRRK